MKTGAKRDRSIGRVASWISTQPSNNQYSEAMQFERTETVFYRTQSIVIQVNVLIL